MIMTILALVLKAASLTLGVPDGPAPVPYDPDVPTCDVKGDYGSCDSLADQSSFNCDHDVTCSEPEIPSPPPPPRAPEPEPSSLTAPRTHLPIPEWDPDVPTCDVQGDFGSCDSLADQSTYNCDYDVTCNPPDLPSPPPPARAPEPDPSSLTRSPGADDRADRGDADDRRDEEGSKTVRR